MRKWAACAVLAFLSLGLGCSGPEADETPDGRPSSIRGLVDLRGDETRLLFPAEHVQVWIFVRTDCPIANRYAPEITRIAGLCAESDFGFGLVYPEEDDTLPLPDRLETIAQHLEDYGLPTANAFYDPRHQLVEFTGVSITPEAAVLVGNELVYRGRIDDQYVDFNRVRAEPTTRDLRDVLSQITSGAIPEFRSEPAVGCPIPPLERTPVVRD